MFTNIGRATLVLCALVLALLSTSCAESGAPGIEYRWSSQTDWRKAPSPRPDGDERIYVRTVIPELGERPAMRLYQPPSLEAADIDGVPLELGDRWAFERLPAGSAGKHLTMRYRSRYAIINPIVDFGSEDTLAGDLVRSDLPTFGIGVAMWLLGLGALASLLLRRSRAWFFFGLFALSIGTMTVLEVQDLFSVLPIVWVRDPVHETSIFLIGVGFAGFIAEVFGGRWARALRVVATSSAACAVLMLIVHLSGALAGRRLRFLAEAHVVVGLVLGLMATVPRRQDRSARVFLVGIVVLLVTAVPDLLNGLGLLDVATVKWGVAFFVLCMGHVLYGHYEKAEVELERRVRDVEALNAELRHQIAERSRELTRNLPVEASSDDLPKLGMMVAGRYRVLRELGSGGMGQVFEVVRTSDGALFALKIMHGQSASDAARFAREAEIAAKLAHPNLVSVVDVGIGSWGMPFIVMELVTGGNLADRTLDEESIGPILGSVARGLVALHEHGVVHRDLKPSNVLLSERDGVLDVKLADFGIARSMASPFDATQRPSSNVTRAGAFLGTPLYMAPEQAVGAERAGPAADVFSFGVMAYELWFGEPPFLPPLVFLALSNVPFPAPPSFDARVADPRLRALLRGCLSATPDERPTSQALASAFAAAFPSGDPIERS